MGALILFAMNTAGLMPELLLLVVRLPLVISELSTVMECANVLKDTHVTMISFVFQMLNANYLKIQNVLQMKNGMLKVTSVGNKTVVTVTQPTMITTVTNAATPMKDMKLASVEVVLSVTAKDSVFSMKNATLVSTLDVVFPMKNGLIAAVAAPKNATRVTRPLIRIQCALRSVMNSASAQKDSFGTCPTTAASQSTSVRMICVCIMNNGMSKAMTVGINRAAKMDHLAKLVIHDATVQEMIITKSVFVNLDISEIQLECVLPMANVLLLWVFKVNVAIHTKSGPTVAANANKNVTPVIHTCTLILCALKSAKKCVSVT
jgi:hypothetical protein